MHLLAGLHAIAARRGDGLRPELVRLLGGPEPRSGIDPTWPRSALPNPPKSGNNEVETPSKSDLIRVLWPISRW